MNRKNNMLMFKSSSLLTDYISIGKFGIFMCRQKTSAKKLSDKNFAVSDKIPANFGTYWNATLDPFLFVRNEIMLYREK